MANSLGTIITGEPEVNLPSSGFENDSIMKIDGGLRVNEVHYDDGCRLLSAN